MIKRKKKHIKRRRQWKKKNKRGEFGGKQMEAPNSNDEKMRIQKHLGQQNLQLHGNGSSSLEFPWDQCV
ncbi:hypothetical protein K2173_023133 [Erythroxylum novogranatense]|uniref:Uncharacterized protein n=1 Tax=Erythroxylum novogranatense TaxID=1862640 RepID=A0AAV8UC88_9ROSI|nr:hypothetical protein K2173_023133 [Erythroxylum novogranatense]